MVLLFLSGVLRFASALNKSGTRMFEIVKREYIRLVERKRSTQRPRRLLGRVYFGKQKSGVRNLPGWSFFYIVSASAEDGHR